MAATAKFLFDNDFAPGPKAPRAVSIAEHEAKLADAETRGYRNGFTAAEAEAAADTARLLAGALDRIASGLAGVAAQLHAIEGRHAADAIDVAVAAARKLAPELIAREPFAEIAALLHDSFRHLVSAPHIVVRVGDAIYPQAREKLETLAHAHGFTGRLIVLAEPDIALGDCRIEWADGGITRDRAATEATIMDIVNRYIAARRTVPHGFEKGEER